MKKSHSKKHSLEALESRIAPATVPLTAQWIQATHSTDGSPILLKAGQGLSTSGADSGDYLLYLSKGNALIFTTDLDNDDFVDFNEITGIAAGDGMRLISFVDIHGDIVTNLKETATSSGVLFSLSDSNNNAADDNQSVRGDGRVVLNSRIEAIELRTLTTADIGDQNGDGVVNQLDVDLRRAPTTHSIFGSIYAGGGFGVAGDPTSGLLIDNTSSTNFGFEADTRPMIGSIRVGTAVSGEYFSFGIKGQFDYSGGVLSQRIRADVLIGDDSQGYIVPFVPSPGQAGASISFIRAAAPGQLFNFNGLYAGDGGANAPGGNVTDVTITGDDAGGYEVFAGNGGSGTRGGAGGSILRFSDMASDTSQVTLRTGNGGNASTGAGGNAGNLEILQANFHGDYSFILGSGGDGFTVGGVGAGLTRAIVTEQASVGAVGGTGVGTTHNRPSHIADPTLPGQYTPYFGSTESFDFDADGINDFVYTSNGLSQLAILFGDGFGDFRPDRMYLASPRNAEAVTVADLNNDGRPDIAAASSDVGSNAGIVVYLSKWEDVNKDGDVTDDGVDRFLGFHSPRYSPLPQFESHLPVWEGPHQIAQLVAGDFDGDGANEIAALVTYYSLRQVDGATEVTLSLGDPNSVIVFLTPDRELDTNTGEFFFTGQFFADMGTKRVTTPTANAPAQPLEPYFFLRPPGGVPPGEAFMQVTALSSTSTHDVVVVSNLGARNLLTIDYSTDFAVQAGTWALGQVDTDRRPGFISVPPANVELRDFVMVDFNNDGNVDSIVLAQDPANFVVGVRGDGSGSGVQDSGNGADQSGYFLPQAGIAGTGVGIKAFDADGDGVASDFVLLMDGNPASVLGFDYQAGRQIAGFSGPNAAGALLPAVGALGAYHAGTITDSIMWDLYYPNGNLANPLVALSPEGSTSFATTLRPIPPLWLPFETPQLNIIAGDGGDSFIGRAGNGGSLGGNGRVQTIVDPTTQISVTDYVGSISIAYEHAVYLQGGNGGLGFSKGGNGGSITGVTLRDAGLGGAPSAQVIAGNGGRGVSGTGGFGGDLIANSILNGVAFVAGNGGDGKFGGRGGTVIGNQQKVGTTRIFDTTAVELQVLAGNGGAGIRSGGNGGTIVNFLPIIEGISQAPGFGGKLMYVGGNGGVASGGVGGAGGSVINSSPELNAVIEDQIFIEAGFGGDGRTGGAGGSIVNFAVNQKAAQPVKVVHLLAGHGGDGTTGAGGHGGSISSIDVKSAGFSDNPLVIYLVSPNGNGTLYSYSKMLAGNGGESSGGRGGNGGNLGNIVTSAIQGTVALVGGAGGQGLTQGGAGGSVVNATLVGLGAGTNAKVVVIAGAGGDARAFLPNPLDTTPDQPSKAFGGRVGAGGHGGNINGFTQLGGTGAHVDFIAGNGGSTVNYGTLVDPKPFVGRGGSVMNINLAGTAGNTDPISAIKGYNDALNGETIKDFVETRMRLGFGFEELGDGDGNVGIVVGSAGRNKAVLLDPLGAPYEYTDQPATNAKAGDLINFRGAAIMSAVAGGVDRVGAINLAKSIIVQNRDVGFDKVYNGVVGGFEYWNARHDEILTNPVRDGGLIDGAFIAKNLIQSPVEPSLVGRIYSF